MPAITKTLPRRVGRPRNPPDPGVAQRVRALREAAGLTQAQLAGTDFTKGFISLVETARTGMSLRAARIFAPRLGVSVDELLRPGASRSERAHEVALVKAEVDLAAGRAEDALKAVAPLEKIAQVRARALRLKGRALLERDRADEAVKALDEALRLFRQGPDHEQTARTLFDLAQAYARKEAFGEAANYALQCETEILSGHVVDASLEMRLLSFIAGVFVTLGDMVSADARIERARRLAEDIGEPAAAGNLYFNLSVLRQREGDPEAALRFALKALESYQQLGVRAHVGSVYNTLGWIHVRRGRFALAETALSQAEQIADETHDERLRAYVVQSRAELELARGHAAEAVRLADQSIELPGASARARALSKLVRASALAKSGAPLREIDAAYAKAVQALRPFGSGLVARAYRAHFNDLMSRGEKTAAAEVAKAAFEAVAPDLA